MAFAETNSTKNGHSQKPVQAPSTTPASSSGWSSIFSLPAPVRRVFDTFPLRTLPANDLPLRAQYVHRNTVEHSLFIWTTPDDAEKGRASFNPHCLRWQAFFKSREIPYKTINSSNHASTLERLPFVIEGQGKTPWKTRKASKAESREMVSAHDLARWAAEEQDGWPKQLEGVYEAYNSLLNNEIRRAWQYHMYLTDNFTAFTVPAYINSQSSSTFVRLFSTWELRRAAEADLLKTSVKIDVDGIYASAERALAALDNLMQRKKRLSTKPGHPSLLESTLFAYLFLLLEMPMTKWKDTRLVDIVRKFPGLVRCEGEWKKEFGLAKPGIYHLTT